MPSLLEIAGLTRRFGGLTAVNAVDLKVAEGELVSVIGPNGAGKTTLFNLVTGLDQPDGGALKAASGVVTKSGATAFCFLSSSGPTGLKRDGHTFGGRSGL